MTGQAPQHKPSGTIGLATRDFVYAEFALNLARLAQQTNFDIYGALNYDLAHARNGMVEIFEGDYLWLMDDDHTFEPDILKRLLAHKKDIVGPLVLGRRAPFVTCARVDGKPLDRNRPAGLVQCDRLGGAGMLIHRRVFDAISPPWFLHGRTDPNDSQSHQSDDAYFCNKALEAGFELWCDTSVHMGHMTICNLNPEWQDGHQQWFTRADLPGDAHTWFAQEEN